MKEMLRGSAPFWTMARLAMTGELASCQSCVEYWYFQSKQNAVDFLESCAAGGLVERVSLIDLHGDLESVAVGAPTLRQQWYDQAIYISAPAFRKQNLDISRRKIENTKNAVFEAFHLYREVLKANDNAIDCAYFAAIHERKLRFSEFANERIRVDLSHVAKLRLIKDGFKKLLPNASPEEVDEETVSYILSFDGRGPVSKNDLSDFAEELDEFILEFFASRNDLHEFWQADAKFHFWLFPVLGELIRLRVAKLIQLGNEQKLRTFTESLMKEIESARVREEANAFYLAAVDELVEDCQSSLSNLTPTPIQPPQPQIENRI